MISGKALESIKNKPLIVSTISLALFSVLFVFAFLPTVDSLQTSKQTIFASDELIEIHGVYTLIHKDKDGNVLSYQQFENLIPNEGLECVSDLVFGTAVCVGEAFYQFIGIGTSAVAPADADLTLGAESGTCARVQDSTPTSGSPSSGVRTIALQAIFSGGTCEGQTFTEVGLFDASTSGNMISRTLLSSSVTLTVGSTLTVNYQVNLNN